LGWVVALGDLSALAVLLGELEGRLEEVHEQSRSATQARDGLGGRYPLKAAIAQELPHDRAVLLFDPSLVVLAVRARARELDTTVQAILDQRLVYKFAAIVDIQRAKGKRQADADALKCLNNEAAFAHHKRRRLGPTASNIGQDQAVNVATAVNVPAMGDQIHFHAARKRFIPISKRAQRHAPARLRHCPARPLRTRGRPWDSQRSVNRRCTHSKDLRADRLIELQVSVALQSGQQNRQQGPQALATDSIG